MQGDLGRDCQALRRRLKGRFGRTQSQGPNNRCKKQSNKRANINCHIVHGHCTIKGRIPFFVQFGYQ